MATTVCHNQFMRDFDKKCTNFYMAVQVVVILMLLSNGDV